MQIALQLQQSANYEVSLDWYRILFDYSTGDESLQKIFYGLVAEEGLSPGYERLDDWLLDPLNPHAVAATRRNTYSRFTLISIIRCFLEFGVTEATFDTQESVAKARLLFQTALKLVGHKLLRQKLGGCAELIGTIELEFGDPMPWNVFQWALKPLSAFNDFSLLCQTALNIDPDRRPMLTPEGGCPGSA